MRTTIKDIAAISNVSIATVSKIINGKDESISEETRKRVQRVIKEKNYVPNTIARTLVTKQSKTIGMIVPDICNPFFSQLIRGAEHYTNLHGYDLLISNTDDDEKKQESNLQVMKKKMIDGIILTSTSYDIKEDRSNTFQLPAVLVDRVTQENLYIGKVEVDNCSGGYLATSHLLKKGCKTIVFLAGNPNTLAARGRYEGYRKALEEYGIPINETIIRFGSFHTDFGYRVLKELLDAGHQFDGVFASSDIIAFGAMQALKEQGYLIPTDVKVIGFDDIYISSLVSPTLSTIRQPIFEMGEAAAKLLLDYLESKKNRKRTIVFDTQLIERESTK